MCVAGGSGCGYGKSNPCGSNHQDEGLSILKETPYWAQTMQIITEKVEYYLNHRAQERLEIGAVLYSMHMETWENVSGGKITGTVAATKVIK